MKIKKFVIGRKNWLFCYSPAGAQASAIIYSIIETAKANGKNPQAYLENVFEGIRQGKPTDDLLPWNILNKGLRRNSPKKAEPERSESSAKRLGFWYN